MTDTERDKLRALLHAAWVMMDKYQPSAAGDGIFHMQWQWWLKEMRSYFTGETGIREGLGVGQDLTGSAQPSSSPTISEDAWLDTLDQKNGEEMCGALSKAGWLPTKGQKALTWRDTTWTHTKTGKTLTTPAAWRAWQGGWRPLGGCSDWGSDKGNCWRRAEGIQRECDLLQSITRRADDTSDVSADELTQADIDRLASGRHPSDVAVLDRWNDTLSAEDAQKILDGTKEVLRTTPDLERQGKYYPVVQECYENLREHVGFGPPYARHLREGGWSTHTKLSLGQPTTWWHPDRKDNGEVLTDKQARALYDAGARWQRGGWALPAPAFPGSATWTCGHATDVALKWLAQQ